MNREKERIKDGLIRFLMNPDSYPHNPKEVVHIQTHASHVFIVSPYVYKVKKPVDFGFLDFSTLEKRKYYCEIEVELNLRLCSAYLGVSGISRKDGAFTFGDGGETVEYAVKMDELPEKYFLKNLIREGNVGFDGFSRVVGKLVDFYRSQPREERISEMGKPENVKISIDENFSGTAQFVGKTISKAAYDAVEFYNELFFDKNWRLFLERVEKGFIKDCHGDLHLEHIHLTPEEVCIYDCIEFNQRLRHIDIASDIAFLSMDLDFNGYRDLANFIVSEVSERMDDETVFEIIDFYKCYRAYVRGKVESIKSEEEEVEDEDRKASLEKAEKYFRLALKYSLFGSNPAMLVTFGIIGTGKSTLARRLSEEISCEVISSDVVRKEITDTGAHERKYEEFGKGIYSEDVTERTYDEIIKRGAEQIEKGQTAILDASFSRRQFREKVIERVRELEVPVYFLETRTSDKVIRERLSERERRGDSVSDGRLEILDRFVARFDPPSELPEGTHIPVDTDRPPEETLKEVLKEIMERGF